MFLKCTTCCMFLRYLLKLLHVSCRYVSLKACITRLPENGYGANVSSWPARSHEPPQRLQEVDMDAYIARNDIFEAESQYWNEIVEGHVRVFHWEQWKLRNVMDMRAGFGG